MKALPIQIELLQPLLLATTAAGEENSSISLDYIPGAVLRGALIERYRQRHPDAALMTDPVAQRLFFSGEVIYLHSYLATLAGQRSLPTPLSWAKDKEQEKGDPLFYDLIIDDSLDSPQTMEDPYCWVALPDEGEDDDSVQVIFAKPERQVQLHNSSQQRFVKQESDSTLFRYDALAPEQRFATAILCEDAALLEQAVRPLLEPTDLLFGRSRSAGYGRVRVKVGAINQNWSEYAPMPQPETQQIILALLSDTILRHPDHGGYITDLPVALGLNAKADSAFVKSDVTGGFNRTWGMTLPQTPVLKAGSVWAFNHDGNLYDRLQGFVKTGIGERCIEGFGRIAINWHTRSILQKGRVDRVTPLRRTIELTGESQGLAERMVLRLYRQQLDNRLLELATGALEIQGEVPESAQLSRLRVIVRQAQQAENPKLVTEFLRSLRDNAKTQFRRARLDGKPFLRWLEEGWKEDGLWKNYLFISQSNLPRLGTVVAQEDAALRIEYMARLVDSVCKRAIQQRQEEERV
jgi:CRISPR-associated protein Csx10